MTGLHFLELCIQRLWANHQMLLTPVYSSSSPWLHLGPFGPLQPIMAWGS